MSEQNSAAVLNGDSPHSNTLRHLLTLPAVQDGVRAFRDSSVGRMSIQLGNSAYNLVGAPIMSLFHKPLAYVTPYAQRVDELGDQTLTRVVEKYPAVKKPSPELLQEARDVVYRPVRHVGEVYRGVYERTGGTHAVASSKAAVKTAAVVSVEGTIFALREALRLGESFRIGESLRSAIDQLEKAALRRRDQMAGNGASHNQEKEENPDDVTLKAAST